MEANLFDRFKKKKSLNPWRQIVSIGSKKISLNPWRQIFSIGSTKKINDRYEVDIWIYPVDVDAYVDISSR